MFKASRPKGLWLRHKPQEGIRFIRLIVLAFLAVLATSSCTNTAAEGREEAVSQELQNGDILFQTSMSSQSQAIQLATNSKYSHMGILYETDGQFKVFEAVGPVKLTPLDEWIARGQDQAYVVKRLKEADRILTENTLAKMKQVGEQYNGLAYDLYFEWSDDKMYCSELVWKIYKQATGIEIGQMQKLSEFDLSHNLVKQKMQERYGSNVPMDENVISPAAMFHSNQLVTVKAQ